VELYLAIHPCQRRLRLGQPEGHVHGAVQVDGGGEFGTGLRSPAKPGVEGAKTVVAVCLQQAHAKLLGQGKGLAVVSCGLLDFRGLTLGGNVAQEAQDPRLVPPFLVGLGELECLLGKGQRLLWAAGSSMASL
jgi:hypothetical protein